MRFCFQPLLLLGAVGFIAMCSQAKRADSGAGSTVVVPVKKGAIEDLATWMGTVRSSNRMELRADRKVKISKNQVHNFDSVKKGQLLLEVDNTETELKVRDLRDRSRTMDLEFQSVNIKYRHAQKVVDRKKSLFDKGIIAQKEYDEASRDFRLAGSELRAKELEMEKMGRDLAEALDQMKSSNFVAPMEGVVTGLVIPDSAGIEVQAGQSVATISDPGRLALWVGVEEPFLHKIKQDMKAVVTLDSIPDSKFAGTIISIGTSEIPGSAGRVRVYEVGIAFSPGEKKIREGYKGRARVVFERKDHVLMVPTAALRYSDGKTFLYVASKLSLASAAKQVATGIRTDNETEIVSGVSENDNVVLDAGSE